MDLSLEYQIVYDDGREPSIARGFQVGRFGVRCLPNSDEWVVDHIPTGLRIIEPTTFTQAVVIADDVSRFSVSDPYADNTKGLSFQLGEKMIFWIEALNAYIREDLPIQNYRAFYEEPQDADT